MATRGKNTYEALGIETESWGAVNKLIAIILSSKSGGLSVVFQVWVPLNLRNCNGAWLGKSGLTNGQCEGW